MIRLFCATVVVVQAYGMVTATFAVSVMLPDFAVTVTLAVTGVG